MAALEPRLIESAPLRYLLSVPPGPEPVGPRPVLVFLHGYDEGAPMDIHRALTLHGPLRSGNPAVARQRFVVVAPQLPARGDLWLRSADAVRQIVRQVQAEHRGDPERTYLTGFSFGGNGVFDLALAQPGVWAAPVRVADPGSTVMLVPAGQRAITAAKPPDQQENT